MDNERDDYVATGSAPDFFTKIEFTLYRGVAQLVARLLWEQDVGGSNPFTPTKNKSKPLGFGLFFFVKKDFNSRNLEHKQTPGLLWATHATASCGR